MNKATVLIALFVLSMADQEFLYALGRAGGLCDCDADGDDDGR